MPFLYLQRDLFGILFTMDPTTSYLKALSSALAKGDATEHTGSWPLK